MYEVIGIAASVIVLLSFIMNGEKKIRMVNILGALLFVIYGILISSISVWFLNSGLLILHIYKLVKMFQKENK